MNREKFILSALLDTPAKFYGGDTSHIYIKDPTLQPILDKANYWASLTNSKPNPNLKQPLRPVLEQLNREGNYTYGFHNTKLELDEKFFPKKQSDSQIQTENTILINRFFQEINTLPRENITVFIENCYNLLYKYTCTIPVLEHLPDVPMFDHAKSVTAFAVCIYDYLKEHSKTELHSTDKTIIFLGGSISGIQSYIYSIISKFANKNLKGRSFYLQLLVDSILEKILHELKLFHANVIYASGGSFFILVPNTQSVRNKIKTLQEELSEKLFYQFKTSLYISISDSVELCETDLTQNNLPAKWNELHQSLDNKKRAKYIHKLQNNYAYFFETAEQGGMLKKDIITNEEITTEHLKNKQLYEITEDDIQLTNEYPQADKKYILSLTHQQIELGECLRQTNYIVQSTELITSWENNKPLHIQQPLDLGIYWYFFDKYPVMPKEISCTLIQLNNPDTFMKTSSTHLPKNIIYNFTLYGGNEFPSDDGYKPKNFNDLAGTAESMFKRLAILRMDVDNLGNAFMKGLGSRQVTFSRYSTLSRSLDFFFKGYINTLWKKNENFKKWIYIVYSGGDDLFIVGKWDSVIEFAKTIREKFSEWACKNTTLSLSAGIAIVPPKYPLLKAAELSGEAEEKAKNHTANGKQKNAICLLDLPLNWELEFPIVESLKKELITNLQKELLPKGFLHKIQSFYQMSANQRANKENESWKWIMAYDFKRMTDRKKDNTLREYLEGLKMSILTNKYKGKELNSNYHFIELLNIAARWAELEIRTNKSETNH